MLTAGTGVQDSYAQWVRRALAMARARPGDTVSLFESSVPEPRELLRQTVVRAMEPRLSPFYASAFGGGNPFVLEKLAERHGVSPEQVLGTTGATGALSLLYRTFARRGDHILVETPGFDLFETIGAGLGLEFGHFERGGPDYTIDVAAVEAKLRAETRLIVLSDLHNPTGMLLDRGVLAELARMAERRGVLLVVDEVYGDYAPAALRPAPASTLSPAVVSVSSLTKIFGLAALRCGWIVGAREVVAAARDFAARIEFGMSTLSHSIAAHVLEDPVPFRSYAEAYIGQCRPIFDSWFEAMAAEGLVGGLLPASGCICFPRLPGIADTLAFSNWLVERHGVIVAPGEYFGAPGHVRIGFCLDEKPLVAGLSALAEGLRQFGAGENRIPMGAAGSIAR
ncbi:pyridoxal phosphate-dependent aminotransferase [Sandaracinobacter sp. RS1-74]|uniref:pyridoxal phosphate-dependent aminotransferase n=1 Tax=Sandaracinobacteroides sayramensis TaxID=2913411 RepID=UPI001EDA3E78|nr:pyridoxal phosphate-dependent aminotransferase [Sandaracinobacteroides sayramensis]MCG2842077.1 pyridoxal phosphate-dependent aminotransferase [Sandaracinobacteroides sayramensis]